MEKDRIFIRKRDIVLGTVLAASLSAAVQSAGAKSPSKPEIYPQSAFRPAEILDKEFQRNKNYTSSGKGLKIEIPVPTSLSKEEQINQELKQVLEIMSANPDIFKQKYIEDVKMYYPIYKAAGDKYNVDWFLLWIVHEAETGASNSKIAFNGGTIPYFGGMQRNPQIWPQSYVDEAYSGLEFLDNVKTKHKTDAKEIAAAARELGTNINKYIDLGKDKAVLNALLLYSADEPAKLRFRQYKNYEEIFLNSESFVVNINTNGY